MERRGSGRNIDNSVSDRIKDNRGSGRNVDNCNSDRNLDNRGSNEHGDNRGSDKNQNNHGSYRNGDDRGCGRNRDNRDFDIISIYSLFTLIAELNVFPEVLVVALVVYFWKFERISNIRSLLVIDFWLYLERFR